MDRCTACDNRIEGYLPYIITHPDRPNDNLCQGCFYEHMDKQGMFRSIGVPNKFYYEEPVSEPTKSDGRHEVSDKLVDMVHDLSYAQDDYGMDKYKKPLHHSFKYDWLHMAMEEYVDMGKYIKNEIDRRQAVIDMLALAMRLHDWKLVDAALDIMTTSGTGKEARE